MKSLAVLKGALDYLRFPQWRDSWGGPFNGQANRQAMFEDLLANFDFDLAVETGTYRGTTTSYLADCKLRVISIELDDYYFGYSTFRFCLRPRVTVFRGNSGDLLGKILSGQRKSDRGIFFYLDAHWDDYLPLEDEVATIFERVAGPTEVVVMVDDFQVPDDMGYAFDDYGSDKALTLRYLDNAIDKFALSVFFPACPSEQETGAKRGCVVLARTAAADMVRRISSLREYKPNLSA